MRKCKYIGQESSYLLTIGDYYYYDIIKYRNNNTKYEMPFPYHIYDNTKLIATFSKDYFDVLFFDVAEQRKEKLKKLNEKF